MREFTIKPSIVSTGEQDTAMVVAISIYKVTIYLYIDLSPLTLHDIIISSK